MSGTGGGPDARVTVARTLRLLAWRKAPPASASEVLESDVRVHDVDVEVLESEVKVRDVDVEVLASDVRVRDVDVEVLESACKHSEGGRIR